VTSPGLSWRLFALLAALTAFGPMSLDLYLPAFPDIAADFGATTGDVQLTFSAALLGLGVGQLLWGPLSDRYGRRRPLMAGLLVFAVASVGIALAPSLPVMVGLRVVQALGGSAGIVIARAVLRDLFSGRALARALGTVMLVFMLAPALAPVLGWLVLHQGGWPAMFFLLAGFGALCFVGVLAMPETLPVERRSQHGVGGALRTFGTIVRSSDFRVPAAVSALGSIALFAYISFSPRVVMDGYGLPEWGFALVFGGLAVGIALGAVVNSRLLAHHSSRWVLQRALVVQAVGAAGTLLAAVVGAPFVVFVAVVAVAVATVIPVNSNAVALAMDPFPHAAASAAALLGGLQQVLAGLAAAGLAASALDPGVAMGVGMLAASATGLALVLFLVSHARPVPAEN
jgi:DHA1 family bicyclomycin/chloramphenicol resistance-like MFS transporter